MAILLTLAIVPLTSVKVSGKRVVATIEIEAIAKGTLKYEGLEKIGDEYVGDYTAKIDEIKINAPDEITLPLGAWVKVKCNVKASIELLNTTTELVIYEVDLRIRSAYGGGVIYEEVEEERYIQKGNNIVYEGSFSEEMRATPGLLGYILMKKGLLVEPYIHCYLEFYFRDYHGYCDPVKYVEKDIRINIGNSTYLATPLLTSLVKSKHTPAKMPFLWILEKSKQILPIGSLIKSILNSIEEKPAERSEKMSTSTSTSERRNPTPNQLVSG